jgi:hypothetical protein
MVHLRGQLKRCSPIHWSFPGVHDGGCLQIISRKKLLRQPAGFSTVAVVHPIELDHDLPLFLQVAGRKGLSRAGFPERILSRLWLGSARRAGRTAKITTTGVLPG